MGDLSIKNNETTSTSRKILITGLQKSGKTSIILSLKGQHNLMSYFSLKPTPGLEINKLSGRETEFIIWELGGQDYYRNKYLDNFSHYSDNVMKLIYVIDVQDSRNYEKSLTYLKEIINNFENLKQYPEISIFLHKFDPEIKNDPKFSGKKIRDGLIDPIKKIISNEFSLEILKTTIYTVFRQEPF